MECDMQPMFEKIKAEYATLIALLKGTQKQRYKNASGQRQPLLVSNHLFFIARNER